jgi:hypothetical protein
MAPSHGFAAASHREAALRGAPASHGETAFRGAAGFREPAAAMRSTHRETWRDQPDEPRRRRIARLAGLDQTDDRPPRGGVEQRGGDRGKEDERDEPAPHDAERHLLFRLPHFAAEGRPGAQTGIGKDDHDNYGESNSDCSGFPASGANRYGRLWPVLSGERGEYELAQRGLRGAQRKSAFTPGQVYPFVGGSYLFGGVGYRVPVPGEASCSGQKLCSSSGPEPARRQVCRREGAPERYRRRP